MLAYHWCLPTLVLKKDGERPNGRGHFSWTLNRCPCMSHLLLHNKWPPTSAVSNTSIIPVSTAQDRGPDLRLRLPARSQACWQDLVSHGLVACSENKSKGGSSLHPRLGSDLPPLLPYSVHDKHISRSSSSTRRQVAQKQQKPQIRLMRIWRHYSGAPNLVKSPLRQLACNKHERSSSQMQTREPRLPAKAHQQMRSVTSTPRTGRLQRRQRENSKFAFNIQGVSALVWYIHFFILAPRNTAFISYLVWVGGGVIINA